MAPRECCICADDVEETVLLELPCGDHFICAKGENADDCLQRYFRQAIDEERHYPVNCCDAVMLIDEYEGIINWDFVFEFKTKEREYQIHTR